MFSYLTFEIKFTNEGDGHDKTYIYQYKNSVKTEIETYSSVDKSIRDNGGVENILKIIFDYCNQNDIMIDNYITNTKNPEKISWLEFCKIYIEKYPNCHKSGILAELSAYLENFFEKYKINNLIYINKELSNSFFEKVKNM